MCPNDPQCVVSIKYIYTPTSKKCPQVYQNVMYIGHGFSKLDKRALQLEVDTSSGKTISISYTALQLERLQKINQVGLVKW